MRLAPILFLAACSGSTPTESPADQGPELTKIRLALNWYPEPEFGGFYEGVLGGHYADAGFDVEIIPGGPGAPTLELLGTGQSEAAITMADDLLVKRSKGIAAIGVWPGFQLSPQGLMAHESRGVTKFEDITEGQVAIEIGSSFQSYLWETYGWEGKVEPVPYGGSVGPFLADEKLIQQGYITSEPCVAEAQGAKTVFLRGADAGWNPYGTLLAVPDPAPDWTDDFVAATQASWQAYMKDPSRANAEITKQNDQMKAELMGCITDKQKPFVEGTDGMGSMSDARWEELTATLVKLKLLDEGASPKGAYKAR